MKTLLPILFWMVTWQQATWVPLNNEPIIYCYPQYVTKPADRDDLTKNEQSIRFDARCDAYAFLDKLKRDSNASDIRVFEYKEVEAPTK